LPEKFGSPLLCPSCGTDVGDTKNLCPSCGTAIARTGDEYVGKKIANKYRIEQLIGEGGMGKVYKATQLTLDKAVVLKVLRQSLLSDERTVARFQREAKAASRLNHPNSIGILDFGQAEDGALYIAMEYVSGKDLHQILSREWPLPEARIVRIASQVLSALQDAHAAGVIHRDLKPENIMVEPRRGGETDFVKVLDFGIAKIQDMGNDEGPALTRAGFVCGTPEYMSPEQARGANLDPRSDLYAVGVILYQLTTGLLPFESDSAVGFATKHLTEEPPAPSKRRPDAKISPAMERLILRALSKNPDDRPQTAESFKAELGSVGKAGRSVPRRGMSSPVLQPIPAKHSHEGMRSPWAQADETVRTVPSSKGGEREDSAIEGPTMIATSINDKLSAQLAQANAAASAQTTRTAVQPPPTDAIPVTAPSMLPFKIITIVLVAITVGLAGYYLYQLYFAGTSDAYQLPTNAPVRVGEHSIQGEVEPLYRRNAPRNPSAAEAAERYADEANSAYARGDLGAAVSDLQDAFDRDPNPLYALKLGAIYRVRGEAGEREARGWWGRYLHDVPDSPAKAQIVAEFPELANAQ
jgi:serine/threonine protein kinase